MIEFHPLRPEDRTAIERYTRASDIRNCDLAFANMYCWQDVYRSAWAEVDGFLVVRFHIDGGPETGYMQPVGPGDFTEIVPVLSDDARAHGQRLRIVGLTPEGCRALRERYPGRFAFDADRALADYIYDAEALRTLRGSRYQPKRNHFNRFAAEYPDYRYEKLTPERFAECMTLEREWRRTHEGHTSELNAEQRAMQQAFAHFEELDLYGGCIYAGGRLAAFTYGSAVGQDTFVTHVEKADMAFEGAFTAINKLFAEHLPERFKRINREEDLGLEGLRRAKLSYHPTELLLKYTAADLSDDEKACKELWQKVFGDDDAFVDRFLLRYYDRRRMLSIRRDDRIAAMLHLLPLDGDAGPADYIYGVATDPEYRGQGLATQLLRQALQRCDARQRTAMLIPSPEQAWLRDFYGRFGFAGAVPVTFDGAAEFDFGTGDPTADRAMILRRDTAAPLPERMRCSYKR